jgi:hypothetical protein
MKIENDRKNSSILREKQICKGSFARKKGNSMLSHRSLFSSERNIILRALCMRAENIVFIKS